jgi:hypothetical protein
MINKKSFLVRDVVFAGIIFCGVIALLVILVGNMANNYNNTEMISSSFSNNYNKLNQIVNGANGLSVSQNSVTNVSGLQLQGNFDIAFSSTWVTLNLIWATVDIFTGMGVSMISDFTFLDKNVVWILLLVLTSLLVTIIIFNIISSITRGRL